MVNHETKYGKEPRKHILIIVEILCSVGKETILESGLKCKESVYKEKQVNWQIQKGPVNYHR